MGENMSSTEVARRFGEILAAVKHGGKSVVVTKNGEPVAELRPVDAPKTCTLRAFAEHWKAEPDEAFADDLANVNAADRPAPNPWD